MSRFPSACLLFLLLLFLLPANASAQKTIRIPADQPTIQAGINAAAAGDTVLVAPGTYYENIDFLGKAITVTSAAGAPGTILDGSLGKTAAVIFQKSETRASVLNGFTIQNGGVEVPNGYVTDVLLAGIYILAAQPTISNNILTHNHCHTIYSSGSSPLILNNEIDNTVDTTGFCSFAGGTAIWLSGSLSYYNAGNTNINVSASVIGNLIQNNTESGLEDAGGNGGVGVAVWGADALIESNIIRNNSTRGEGAIYAFNTDKVKIIGNLIYNNVAYSTSAGIDLEPPDESAGPFIGIVSNNTVYGNTLTSNSAGIGTPGSQIYLSGNLGQYILINNLLIGTTPGMPVLSCDTVYNYLSYTPLVFDHNDLYNAGGPTYSGACPDQTGTYGNLSADPHFLSPGTDFHLAPGSPAIDSGNNSAPMLLPTDVAGSPRIQDSTGLGHPVVDMGAYETAGLPSAVPTFLTLTPSTYYPYNVFYGNNAPFTLQANLTSVAGVPSGPINFFVDGASLGTLPVDSSGNATLQPAKLAPGLHAFLAVYPGQGAFPPAISAKFYVLFPKTTPSLALTSSQNPSILGNNVTFTVTASAPDGSIPSPIVLTDGSTTLATLTPNAAGIATFSTSALTLGTHYLSANFAGSATTNAGSATLVQNVIAGYPSTTSLVSSQNPAPQGQPITFTSTVSVIQTYGAPTGSVLFSSQGVTLASVPLGPSSPSASGTLSASASTSLFTLPLGFDTIVATYVPSATFASSSASLVEDITAGNPTTLTLSCPTGAIYADQVLTLNFRVTSSVPGDIVGSIAVNLNGNPAFGSLAVSNGAASSPLGPLPVGVAHLAAAFTPSGTYAPSSAFCDITVSSRASTTTLVAAPAALSVGEPTTLTVAVTSASGPLTSGSIQFSTAIGQSGGGQIGAATLDQTGHASLSYKPVVAGPETITANYSGTPIYAASSASTSLSVAFLPTTLTLSTSNAHTAAFQPVQLTAQVASAQSTSLRPTGFVNFKSNGVTIGNGTVNASGLATLTVSTLPVGTDILTADYTGSGQFQASTSSPLSELVDSLPTQTILSATPNPAYQGQPVQLLLQVTTGIPGVVASGQLTLTDLSSTFTATLPVQADGTARLSNASLAPGIHQLTASYLPSTASFLPSQSATPLIVTILPQDFTLSSSSSTLSIQAEHHAPLTLTLTSIGSFADRVSLSCANLPAIATCTFAQPAVSLTANGTASVTLIVDTDAVPRFKSRATPPHRLGASLLRDTALATLFPFTFLLLSRRRRLHLPRPLLVVMVLASSCLLTAGLSGCSGKYPDHTPVGTYTFSIQAIGAGTARAHGASIVLSVTE